MARHLIAVEAVVFDEKDRVLLVRPSRSGEWELPGGKVRRGESIAAAAVREVCEETGVRVEAGGVLNVFYIEEEAIHDVVIFCAIDHTDSAAFPNPPEIVEAGWFPPDRLPSPMRQFTADQIASGQNRGGFVRVIDLRSADWLCGE